MELLTLTKILYIRRSTPYGVHTPAIVQLLASALEKPPHDAQATQLWMAAFPRIQARQILCIDARLGPIIRSLASLSSNTFDVRIANFVADACELMHELTIELELLKLGQAKIASVICLYQLINDLARDMRVWLKHCGLVPQLQEVDLELSDGVQWPTSGRPQTAFTAKVPGAARAWTLYHMCNIKIIDALLQYHLSDLAGGSSGGFESDSDSPGDPRLLLIGLHENCRILLDLAPFVVGLCDNTGRVLNSSLQDIGLLIVQYPLWTIQQSTFASQEMKARAFCLLELVAAQRGITRDCPLDGA